MNRMIIRILFYNIICNYTSCFFNFSDIYKKIHRDLALILSKSR